MAKRKHDRSISHHLASTGFIFPRNVEELRNFDALEGAPSESVTGAEIDPMKILSRVKSFSFTDEQRAEVEAFKPEKVSVPAHIRFKMSKTKPQTDQRNSYKRKWSHKSVVKLIEETGNDDPIEAIRDRAREVVLQALEKGWSGPPFSAIELAKILNFEITPNDTILDARTSPKGKDQYLIEYNPFQKPTRINFSVAHEISHTLFSDCRQQVRNRESNPVENRELEQLCNAGAAEFQLPYVVFPNDANGLKTIDLQSLIDLATKYKSSLESLFQSFVLSVDKPCATVVCSFGKTMNDLTIDYYKASSTFKPVFPRNFKIPAESKAYYCTTPGWSSKETVKWDFLDDKYDIHCVGISPNRNEKIPRVGIIIVPNEGKGDLQNLRINREFGDATKPQGKGVKVIAQVVNTSGALGAGFGKALSKNFPIIKTALLRWKENKSEFQLGNSQLVQVANDTYVVQMLAQKGLFPKAGETSLLYTSLQKCLVSLREYTIHVGGEIYMPLIGAGQARGNWEIIEGLIYSELVNHGIKVTIYMLNKPGQSPLAKSNLSIFNESSSWQKEK